MGVVAEIVLPGHYFDPGRGAERGGVTMVETQALGGQLVEAGGLVIDGSVTAETFPTGIIGHNQNDVGLPVGSVQSQTQEQGAGWVDYQVF